ncbi:MAG: hypothetical protein WCH40_13745 [Verrucomicrobiales bacterium]
MIRAALAAALLSITSARAVETLIEVDGVGCRTRQLAIQKIWSVLPGVTSVTILPRGPADTANRRNFVILSSQAPTLETLDAALGNRSRFYRIRSVTPKDLPTPALSTQPAPARIHP